MKLASSFSACVYYRRLPFAFRNVSPLIHLRCFLCLFHTGKYFLFHSPAAPAPVTHRHVRVCLCVIGNALGWGFYSNGRSQCTKCEWWQQNCSFVHVWPVIHRKWTFPHVKMELTFHSYDFIHFYYSVREGWVPTKKKKRNCQSELKKTNSKPKRWWCRQYYQQQTIALRIILPHFKYLLKLKCGFLILPHKIAASYLCLSVLVNSILPYPSMLQNDLYIFNIARCIYRKFHFNSNSFCFIIRLLFVFHFECLFHRQIQKSKTKERD